MILSKPTGASKHIFPLGQANLKEEQIEKQGHPHLGIVGVPLGFEREHRDRRGGDEDEDLQHDPPNPEGQGPVSLSLPLKIKKMVEREKRWMVGCGDVII